MRREEEHVIISREGDGSSGFPFGLIAGVLIVLVLILTIWFFGFGPGAARNGINVNINVPSFSPPNPYQSP